MWLTNLLIQGKHNVTYSGNSRSFCGIKYHLLKYWSICKVNLTIPGIIASVRLEYLNNSFCPKRSIGITLLNLLYAKKTIIYDLFVNLIKCLCNFDGFISFNFPNREVGEYFFRFWGYKFPARESKFKLYNAFAAQGRNLISVNGSSNRYVLILNKGRFSLFRCWHLKLS